MPGRIAFVIHDASRFAAAYLPLARAAHELGLAVGVLSAAGEGAAGIEAAGARLLPVRGSLDSLNPMRAGYAAGQVAAILKSEKPDLVHCLGLRASLVGGAGCALAGIDRRIYSPGASSELGAATGLPGRAVFAAIRFLLTGPLCGRGTRFLFETGEDPGRFGLGSAAWSEVPVLAGIDPDTMRPLPMPPSPPLRVAVAAAAAGRDGIAAAIEAVRAARARGHEVELSLYDVRDGASSRSTERSRGRVSEPWMTWLVTGPDSAEVWATHHVACLPSRVGGGVPRQLLEAAACGRPLIASNVPGPRGFVSDGAEGFLVPPGDPGWLADAVARLAGDPVLLPRMGAAARARVLHGYTERDVMDAVAALYAEMLGGAARG